MKTRIGWVFERMFADKHSIIFNVTSLSEELSLGLTLRHGRHWERWHWDAVAFSINIIIVRIQIGLGWNTKTSKNKIGT